MTLRGQGAMEYVMSYGWAVLVVLVVGGAMWQLGVLDFGGSVPPTSTGFQAIKPLLATCKGNRNILESSAIGFSCSFVNAAGSDIVVRDFFATVNGKVCQIVLTENIPTGLIPTNDGKYVYHWCNTEDVASCAGPFCSRYVSGVGSNCAADGTWMEVQKDAVFWAGVYRWPAYGTANPCGVGYKSGETYEIRFDFTYVYELGGIESEKHSAGTVRLVAD